jgi:outer membrane protein TolC
VNAILLITVLGTTPISLQEVRQLSRSNIAQRLSELSAAIAAQQTRISVSAILPQANFAADASRTFLSAAKLRLSPVAVDPFADPVEYRQPVQDIIGYNRNNFDVSVSVSQLLFDGGRWWNQIAQSGAAEEAARGQAVDQQFASEFEGVRRFYVLVTAQKTLEVLIANEKRSAHQLEVANALYEAARSSKNDAVQAEINLGNDQISTVTQYSALASAQSDLATWIAHNGAEELIAVEPSELEGEPLPGPTLENSLQLARDNRPLLKALASQVRAADLGVAVAQGGYWPSLQAQVSYLRQGNTANPFFTDRHKNNTLTMGLALRWNLFSGLATDAQVRSAVYNRSSAQLNLEQFTHDVEADVRRTLRSLESSLRASKFARANLQAATYGSTLAQDRFKAGAGSTLEVRDAQLKLAQAELTLIQNRVNVEVARANLERAIGSYLKAY